MIRKRTISCNDDRGNECILAAGAVVSSIETLLGSDKSLKCCLSSGTSVITSSTPTVLESINVEHPAGFIINSTCQSFQKEFGCGCTTLVCLIGYWATTMQDLLEMGVPVPVIAALMDEALGEFEEVFEKSSISLQSLQDKSSSSQDLTSGKSSALLGERPSATGKCFLQKSVTDNGERAESRRDLTGMSDDCDWYSGDEENFQRLQKAPFDLSRDMVCSNNAFEVKQEIGSEQFTDVSFKSEDTFSTKSAQVKRESNCNNAPHHKSTSSKCFVEKPLENSSFCENYIKPLPHKQPVEAIDEFDACFDDVVEEYETLEIAETEKKMAQGSKKLKKTHSNFESSEHSLIHELLENKDLSEYMATAGRKTNFSKVYLKSRHLVDFPVVTKPEISGLEELNIDNSSRGKRQSLDNSSKKDVSYISEKSKMVKKHQDCNNDEIVCRNSDVDAHWLGLLAYNLVHGNENEMKFALEILHKQYTMSKQSWQEFYFSLDFIAVQTVVGPPSCNSCIVDGVVVMLSKRNDLILTLDCHSPRRIMLVNGDMTCNYKHAGFEKSVEVTRVFEKEDFRDMSLGERKKWIEKVTLVFNSLRVGLVATRGKVDVDLRECLQGFGVVVLENLNHRQIEILSKMTKTSIVSYPLDFVISDLGEAVVTRIWRSGWSSQEIKNPKKARGMVTNTFVQLCLGDESGTERNHVVQTLVLCASVPDLVDDNESKFWNCVHRLRNAFADKRVLPGGGEIEQCCIKHLEKVKDTKVDEKMLCSLRQCTSDCVLFRPLIYDAFIKGLRKFISRVYINAAEDPVETICEKCVFDNFVCKLEGWKRAIRVVKLMLFSEYHIVTGM